MEQKGNGWGLCGYEHRETWLEAAERKWRQCWAAVWDGEGDQTCVRLQKENFQNLVVDGGMGGIARHRGWCSGLWVDDWASSVPPLSDLSNQQQV